MPTQTKWVAPELFLDHGSVKVFHTYKDDDLDQGPNRYWFTFNPECSVERPVCGIAFCPHVFDVRELAAWQPPVEPPYCTGENNTPENQAAWERYWAQETEAIQNALKGAIERGEIGKPVGVPETSS